MLLIDGPNFCWRAHYSGQTLEYKGQPTGVLHIGLQMLADLKSLFDEQRIVFLWDHFESWRKDVYHDYKANRVVDPEMREKRTIVYKQVDIFRTLLEAVGISQLQFHKLEADDLAGMVVHCYEGKKEEFILLSSDKDWYQLLSGKRVQIVRDWTGHTAKWMNEKKLWKDFVLSPDEWPQFQALCGEAGDNIPKVRFRLGPKTAWDMLRRGQLKKELTKEEWVTYQMNLKLTTILRKPSWIDCAAIPRTIKKSARRETSGWDEMERILKKHGLFEVYGRRRDIWTLGDWGRR